MKKLIVLIFATSLIACKENSSVKKNTNVSDQEPNVVEEVGSSKRIDPFKKNYRSNEGMVEDIYKQLTLNDKELIKLDTKIKDLNELTKEVIGEYNSVLERSDVYYNDVLARAKSISDSALRLELDTLTLKSSENYLKKTENVRTLINNANNNLKSINDFYTAFKIKKTMVEIEKYQNTNSFDFKNLNNLITEQNQLLNEIKAAK